MLKESKEKLHHHSILKTLDVSHSVSKRATLNKAINMINTLSVIYKIKGYRFKWSP